MDTLTSGLWMVIPPLHVAAVRGVIVLKFNFTGFYLISENQDTH